MARQGGISSERCQWAFAQTPSRHAEQPADAGEAGNGICCHILRPQPPRMGPLSTRLIVGLASRRIQCGAEQVTQVLHARCARVQAKARRLAQQQLRSLRHKGAVAGVLWKGNGRGERRGEGWVQRASGRGSGRCRTGKS